MLDSLSYFCAFCFSFCALRTPRALIVLLCYVALNLPARHPQPSTLQLTSICNTSYTMAGAAGEAACQLAATSRIVMYDGVCNLCNSAVRYIIQRDPKKQLLFCSVQSPKAEPYLRGIGFSRKEALKRFIFIDENRWFEGSTAALEIAGYMRYPWPLLKTLLVVPLPMREAVYDLLAANRYSWFGKTSRCQVPDTSILERFIDAEDLTMGSCKDLCMGRDAFREERERHWKRWGK